MGFQRAFLLLVLLCATVMVHGQPADISPRYQHFLRQHVKGDMTIQKCQGVMGYLKLTEPDSENCKMKNTFIKANSNQVRLTVFPERKAAIWAKVAWWVIFLSVMVGLLLLALLGFLLWKPLVEAKY
ncbi:hypothetical protein J4Q44_G00306640 [Coregonus suidteri]|uniref:Ribonuclease A-domain domain-containing protein n=1 Tax=Coregonus suidteri TaxID=861788 RepID=A0AAN8KQJ0_9TELE